MLLADGRRPRRGPSSPAPTPMGRACNNTLGDPRIRVLCSLSRSLSLYLSLSLSFPLCGAAARHASTPRQMMDNIVVVQTV